MSVNPGYGWYFDIDLDFFALEEDQYKQKEMINFIFTHLHYVEVLPENNDSDTYHEEYGQDGPIELGDIY